MASDGNRHVKVQLKCPNCRADMSQSIEGTILLRRKAVVAELHNVPDSELSAHQLQFKYCDDKYLIAKEIQPARKGIKPLEIDPTLLGGLEFAMSPQEQKYVTQLMTSGYPDQLCQAAQILSGTADLIRRGMTPSTQSSTDTVTTNNNVATNTARTTAALQAANSNTAMRHGYSNAGVRTNRSLDGERETPVTHFQREMEKKAREKLRRPLPARMPLSVTLSTGEFEKLALKSRRRVGMVDLPVDEQQPKSWFKTLLGRGTDSIHGGASMTFVDDEWDGTVADAFARARIGPVPGNRNRLQVQKRVSPKNPVEIIGVKNILAMGDNDDRGERLENILPVRFQRVLVGSVRGQAGKSGIMKGDVVTHVNGEAFTGNSDELNALLVNAYEEQGNDGVVTIVVNAEACTAEALCLRSRVR
jgi:hypothetical protein